MASTPKAAAADLIALWLGVDATSARLSCPPRIALQYPTITGDVPLSNGAALSREPQPTATNVAHTAYVSRVGPSRSMT